MTATRRWLPFALFAGAALIAGFTALRGIDHFDEGLVLQAAARVADGQLPYRDFAWSYGPAQPYLLGGSFELFGPSLLGWRLLRVLAVALTALLVFVLARRVAGTRLALVAWLVAACALAQPANASPFPVALLLALLALAVAARERTGTHDGPVTQTLAAREPPGSRQALLAGLLCGLAASWRLDFAIYGVAAAGAAFLFAHGDLRRRLELCGLMALAAVATGALFYLPFAIAVGPADLYEELVGKSLREREYWTLPFPLDYPGGLRAWPPSALAEDAKDLLSFYLPLLTVAGFAVAAAAVAARWLRGQRPEPAVAGLLVLALGGASYLLSRTDEFHATPLVVALAVLLPALAARGWGEERRSGRALAVAAACGLALLLAYGAANRLSALFLPPELQAIEAEAADGVRAPPGEARALARVTEVVKARVPPDAPIFVAPRRSDLVAFENPMVYVLAERDNPTRADVGLRAGAAAQRRLVTGLERSRPRIVVRWTAAKSSEREPNLRGRPSGVHTLDLYLAARYRRLERLPGYELLERR